MDPCKGTACLTPVPHQLHSLYQIPESSQKIGPTFARLCNSDEYEEITGNLDGVDLEEFIDFLDEVRSYYVTSTRHVHDCFGRPTRCCRSKT